MWVDREKNLGTAYLTNRVYPDDNSGSGRISWWRNNVTNKIVDILFPSEVEDDIVQ